MSDTGMISQVLFFSVLLSVVYCQSMIDICKSTVVQQPFGEGMQQIIGIGPTTDLTWNPCVIRIETCSHCKIKIEPYGSDFTLAGCDTGYDSTGKSCPDKCQYFYIFDQFYKNQSMTFYRDSSHLSWPSAFRSESSAVFVGFCNGNRAIQKPIQLLYTIELKEKIYRGSSLEISPKSISSPYFPDFYFLNSEYYTYIIESDMNDDYVNIIFTDWDLTSTSTIFIDMGDNTEGEVYKNNNNRPALLAKSSRVKIIFDTGYEYQHGVLRSNMGFKATFTFYNSLASRLPIVPQTDCGSYELYTKGGQLELDTSALRRHYMDCVWVVRTQPGFTDIQLNLLNFSVSSLEYASGENYLEIRRGLSSNGHLLHRFRSGDPGSITKRQYKEKEGFYIHLFGKFNYQDKVKLSYASLNTELLCSSRNNLWGCNNKNCIHNSFKCDGVDHCGDNSDERYGCSGSSTSWQKSSNQTMAFSVIIPVVISIFLIIILFVLFLLVRRYRLAQREAIRMSRHGIPSISEEISHSSGRRRRRRRRGGGGREDLPPAYEEAIQSPPMYPDMGVDPPGPGHWMLPKPPPYSEAINPPQAGSLTPGQDGNQPVPREQLHSNSSSDSSESEQWDGHRTTNNLSDDSSDASPPSRSRGPLHSYSTSYSSESSFENPQSPRHVRYTDNGDTDEPARDSSNTHGNNDSAQEELPIRQIIPQTLGQRHSMETDQHSQNGSAEKNVNQNGQCKPAKTRSDQYHQRQPTEWEANGQRREVPRRNLFGQGTHKIKEQTGQEHLSAKNDRHPHNKTERLSNFSDVMRRVKPRDQAHQTDGQMSTYHASMPNISDRSPSDRQRVTSKSLNCVGTSGHDEDAQGMFKNIQPMHRQYAKSLENISKASGQGSKGLSLFPHDSQLKPSDVRDRHITSSRRSWSPQDTGLSYVPEDICVGSREALYREDNSVEEPIGLTSSVGCVNAAFCESPTHDIPKRPEDSDHRSSSKLMTRNRPQYTSNPDVAIIPPDCQRAKPRHHKQTHLLLESEDAENGSTEYNA